MVKHIEDYPTMNKDPWDYPTGDVITQETRERKPKQSRTGYTTRESTKHFFVDDIDHPYNEEKQFDWMSGISCRRKVTHVGTSKLPPWRY